MALAPLAFCLPLSMRSCSVVFDFLVDSFSLVFVSLRVHDECMLHVAGAL
jgi:hypothetical protein